VGGQSGTTELQVEQVVDRLRSTFREDGGFDAVILSTDKGYSLEQIVGAIMSERLEGNGDI